MAELSDGSILTAVSTGASFFGSSSGRILRLVDDDGDGDVSLNHDATVSVVNGAPGGVLTNLRLWLRADAGVATGAGGVSQWDNQVANPTLPNVQQGTTTQRPDLIASALNFNPVISFDGVNDDLRDT